MTWRNISNFLKDLCHKWIVFLLLALQSKTFCDETSHYVRNVLELLVNIDLKIHYNLVSFFFLTFLYSRIMARSSLRLEELSGFMKEELATKYMEHLKSRNLSVDSIKQYTGYVVKILKLMTEMNRVNFLQTYKDIADLQNLQEIGLNYLPKSHHYVW